MSVLLGFAGFLAAGLLFFGGGFAGFQLAHKMDLMAVPQKTEPAALSDEDRKKIEEERKRLEEWQEAFTQVQSYTAEQAYGVAEPPTHKR